MSLEKPPTPLAIDYSIVQDPQASSWQDHIMGLDGFPYVKAPVWRPALELFLGRKVMSDEQVYKQCADLVKNRKRPRKLPADGDATGVLADDTTSIGIDNLFNEENADRIQKEKQYKQMIFEMYKEVFARSPELFEVGRSYSLSPLSVVFAELYDEMGFEDRILCLKMLGSNSIDRYTEDFI